MRHLSIIIPVRNDAERLARCLTSLRAGARGEMEIIVVDNGSQDASAAVAREAGARVVSIPGRNVAHLRNAAARLAGGDTLGFVDADHVVSSGWTNAALVCLDEDRVGAAGAAYLPPSDGNWVQKMYGALRGSTVGRVPVRWLGAGNMVVRKSAFDQLGGFDESLEACEDVDLCYRLTAAGWQVIGDDRLQSTHYGDPPTLRAVFVGERWRGRNNLQVSLRRLSDIGEWPSVAAPLLFLAGAGALVLSPVLTVPLGGAGLAGAALFVMLGAALPVLQAIRMTRRAGRGVSLFGRALMLTLVYHAGRAAALVSPGRHHRR